VPAEYEALTASTVDASKLQAVRAHIQGLRALSEAGAITIGDAINLAVLEEMLRDPTTVIHAEDLQAGSSYNIPKLTQQALPPYRYLPYLPNCY